MDAKELQRVSAGLAGPLDLRSSIIQLTPAILTTCAPWTDTSTPKRARSRTTVRSFQWTSSRRPLYSEERFRSRFASSWLRARSPIWRCTARSASKSATLSGASISARSYSSATLYIWFAARQVSTRHNARTKGCIAALSQRASSACTCASSAAERTENEVLGEPCRSEEIVTEYVWRSDVLCSRSSSLLTSASC